MNYNVGVSSRLERIAISALIVLCVAGAALGGVALPHATWLEPAVLAVAVVTGFANAMFIVRGLRTRAAHLSARLLAAAYAWAAVLAAAGLAVGLRAPVLGTRGSLWFHLVAPIVVGGSAIIYARVRAHERRAAAVPWKRSWPAWTTALVLALAAPVVVVVRMLLGGIGAGHALTSGGEGTIALCAFGAASCWQVSRPGTISRAFAMAVFAVGFGLLLSEVHAAQFSASWYAEWLLYLSASVIVLISGLRGVVRTRRSLRSAELEMERRNERFVERAQALRELLAISSDADGRDLRGLHALLTIGARHIRQNVPMRAVLGHLEGDTIAIDARTSDGIAGPVQNERDAGHPGRRYPLGGALARLLGEQRRVCWWDDAGTENTDAICGETGWRSAIGATVEIGARTHVLIFIGSEPTNDDPFGADDAAFVEELTTHLSRRLADQVQQARVRFHVEHDALTGLRNRTEFGGALRACIRTRQPFAVAVVDLDGLRQANERRGPAIGRERLTEVAAAFAAVDLRDVVGRLDADDFAILIAGFGDDDGLMRRIEAYRSAFGEHVTGSFGVAVYPRDGNTADELLQRADLALDTAKHRGGGALLYAPDLEAGIEDRRRMREALLEGLATDAFFLEYLPTFAMNSRTIAGAEALVRWNHPTRGLLAPGEFLPFAARAGLMGKLSQWALARVIRDFQQVALPATFRCYVNVPAGLLDDGEFLQGFSALLEDRREFAQHLGIEITEAGAVENAESTILALRRIRQHGIRIAVDDFGTGHSSMAYIKRLPIDVLKIDRTFVSGLPGKGQDATLCAMFLQLAQQFDLVSLAEGIETEAQAAWLREHGCLMGQGFLFSKPLPLAQLLPMLDDQSRTVRPLAI